MKKKISKKIICLILLCVFLLQITPVASNAAYCPIEQNVSLNAEIQKSSDTGEEIVNILLRSILYAALYDAQILPADIPTATMTHFYGYSISDNVYSMTGSFKTGNWFNSFEYTITAFIGDKAFWKNVIEDPTFKLMTALNIGNVIINTVSRANPGSVSQTRKALEQSGSIIGDGVLLKKYYSELPADSELAVIPAFEVQHKLMGIAVPYNQGNHCKFASTHGTFLTYRYPDNIELADWIENGPAFVEMT